MTDHRKKVIIRYVKNYPHRLVFAANQNVKEREYWLKKLSGGPVKVHFPYDHKKTGDKNRKDVVKFRLAGELYSRLMTAANRSDVRLHMILAAGLFALLHRCTGSSGMIIGTPVYKAEVEGEFINTVLALGGRVTENTTFKDLLLQVRKTVVEADEHQDYPIEILAEQLNMPVPEEEFPLFDLAILLENIQDKEYLHHIYDNINMVFSFLRTAECVEGVIEYNSLLYREDTIRRVVSHFTVFYENAFLKTDLPLHRIEILSEEEKRWLTVDFNSEKMEYPRDKTLHELFVEQAEKGPDSTAVTGEQVQISYRELNEESNRLAGLLKKKGVQPDSVVAIMMGRSIEMIAGLLGILKAGGAYLPIGPDYPEDRVNYMLTDSSAAILLAAGEKGDIHISSPPGRGAPKGRGGSAPANHLAYIIYTSGSTGKPKGVPVAHAAVVNLLYALFRAYPPGEPDIYLLKTPFVFDVSVSELFGWFPWGGRLVLLEENGEKDPWKILDTIERQGCTHIDFVPSMFDIFVQVLNPGNINKLISLKYIFLAGEVLLPRLVEKFKRLKTKIALENLYGPTEGTVYVSSYSLGHWKTGDVVPIGKPLANTTLYILDHYRQLQPVGLPGELYIGGIQVGGGYLNNPELTANKFLTAKRMRLHPSPLYKTGDLAKWLPDGNIEFLGRSDHQVKIRGFRIELGEIENCLLKQNEIKEVVVSIRGGEENKYLCAYIVSRGELEIPRLREYLAKELPSYMIPAYFVPVEKVPLTPVGKVDRQALPEPVFGGDKSSRPPRDEVEKQLVRLWSEVIGIEKETIGIDANFFQLGGHSLKAMILVSLLHKEMGRRIPMAQLFAKPTIKGLARLIKRAEKDELKPIEAVEKKDYYLLASAQERLYILQQMEPASTVYNLPEVIFLAEKPDTVKLENVFKKLVRRHESLRTSFHTIADEPVQKIHEAVEFTFGSFDLTAKTREGTRRVMDFICPFDLSRAPLLRAALIKKEQREHILLVDMHHIITDGVSHGILAKEFMALYMEGGEDLPPLRLQYKDYAQWQGNEEKKGNIKKQEQYWLDRFKHLPPPLNLPADYPRNHTRTDGMGNEGGRTYFGIDEKLAEKIRTFALETGCTPFVFLLAAYTILLSKYTLKEDIVVGTTAAGRRHVDFQNIIGMFVNMLAIRNSPQTHKTFREFHARVKENFLGTLENQDYQFDRLVVKLGLQREAKTNPLVETVFVFDSHLQEEDLKEEKSYGFENLPAKFDLTLGAVETKKNITFDFEYRSRLFKKETIERMGRHYKNILKETVENPGIRLSEIPMLGGGEENRIIKKTGGGDIAIEKKTEAGFDF